MNENNYCVIMAGGVGSRFWPLSRHNKPKQFLDILGTGKTLLQQTFERFKNICPIDNILIVTSKSYEKFIFEQIQDIPRMNVLLEPQRRNTGPCIAYAAHKIALKNNNANIIVSPADHLILDENEFTSVLLKSLDFTKNHDVLLTLGIKPSRPETGYGYIQVATDYKGEFILGTDFRKVKTFTEKPEYEMAKLFVESGEFLWNSGIFVWSLKSILKALEINLKDVNDLFFKGKSLYNTSKETDFIKKTYTECRNISIDYGIMEEAENVFVLPSAFGWSDLGTWGSLFDNSAKDEHNNAVKGTNILVYNSSNCIVNVPDEKLVVVHGLNDIIVAESDNILLISTQKDEQLIRQIVNDIRIEKGDDFV